MQEYQDLYNDYADIENFLYRSIPYLVNEKFDFMQTARKLVCQIVTKLIGIKKVNIKAKRSETTIYTVSKDNQTINMLKMEIIHHNYKAVRSDRWINDRRIHPHASLCLVSDTQLVME